MAGQEAGQILLGVDTCGGVGSIALGRLTESEVTLLGQTVLASGEVGATLVQGIADLLAGAGLSVSKLAGFVAVNGPGTFTGIRIGLATVKGMAEALALPVVAVSRLALLATLAGTECSVLDAHRGQIFCGMYAGDESREVLLTGGDVNAMGGLPGPFAVCEESVAQFVEDLAGEPKMVRVAAPTAWDALVLGAEKWRAGEFADVALLDGYYLRGADAKVSLRLG
jgi:tRNA threonylcarbamoyladenosine biosynthesis protein TsaB